MLILIGYDLTKDSKVYDLPENVEATTSRFYSIQLFLFNLTAQIILLYIVVKYLINPRLTELTSASYFQRWRF